MKLHLYVLLPIGEPSLQLKCIDPGAVTCNESLALSVMSAQLDKALYFQRICPITANIEGGGLCQDYFRCCHVKHVPLQISIFIRT